MNKIYVDGLSRLSRISLIDLASILNDAYSLISIVPFKTAWKNNENVLMRL